MLKIKLRPVGKKKQISFRVVIAEGRSKLKGKFVDDLGWYNAHTDKFSLNTERVKKWLANGAQPTDTVYNILVSAGIISGPKIPLHKKSKKKGENESNTASAASVGVIADEQEKETVASEGNSSNDKSALENSEGNSNA